MKRPRPKFITNPENGEQIPMILIDSIRLNGVLYFVASHGYEQHELATGLIDGAPYILANKGATVEEIDQQFRTKYPEFKDALRLDIIELDCIVSVEYDNGCCTGSGLYNPPSFVV